MRLRGLWQITASWLFIVGFSLAACAVTLLTLGAFSRRLVPCMLRFWGRTMLRLARVTYEVQGAEHLAAAGMKIAPFNHGSLLDAFLVTAVMPAGSVAAVKSELLYYPVVGFTVRLLGFLIIDRGNKARARSTMTRACQRMEGESLTVFIAPEGTRTQDGALLPFKKGALNLALDSKAPIVPMLIDNAYELHGPGKLVTTPGHVVIRFLPPRCSAHLTVENVAAETCALHDLYVAELQRMRCERA